MKRLVALWLIASGCSDQCKDGESICNTADNNILVCGPPGDISNTRSFDEETTECRAATCKNLTVDGLRIAVCTTSGQPDPRCDGIEGSTCYDAYTSLACQSGYSQEWDCEGVCVHDDARSIQFCSIESAPNPICDASDPVICDGGAVATCLDHYVVDRIACANACVTSTNGVGYCSAGGACSSADEATCDGLDVLHGCIAGQTVAMTCNPGSECENYYVIATGATQAECVWRE